MTHLLLCIWGRVAVRSSNHELFQAEWSAQTSNLWQVFSITDSTSNNEALQSVPVFEMVDRAD